MKLRQIFVQHLSIDIIIIVASLFGFASEFYGAHKYETGSRTSRAQGTGTRLCW